MKFEALKKYLKPLNLPGYRIKQLQEAIFRKGIDSWDKATTLPADMRQKLNGEFPLLSFRVIKLQESKKDPVKKALIEMHDGVRVETVLMNSFSNHWSVCVSSQAGCPVGCPFCATGKFGLKRNLTAEEISDQVLFWFEHVRANNIADRISSVVYMGMGEPFFNYPAVVDSIATLSNPDYLGIGHRHISVSTSGHADGILKLATDLPQVNLAVSIHTADNEERDNLVPINQRYNLDKLQAALSEYIERTGRQVFIEYTVIDGVNTSARHVTKLTDWIRGIHKNYLVHVNLIACNTGTDDDGKGEQLVKKLSADLLARTINVTTRRSLGRDIAAACGQLAAQHGK